MRSSLLLGLALLIAAPHHARRAPRASAFAQQQPQTLSLLGTPLYAPPVPRDTREKLDADLAAAQAALRKDPSSVDAAIAAARADMGLGEVGDAIEALARARELKPEDPRLLLETAADVIVNRKFDVAERDARKAADTLPDANCVLGFALYLKADYARAKDAYGKCADPGIFAYLADRFTGGSSVPRPSLDEQAKPETAPPRIPGTVVHSAKAQKTVLAAYLDAAEHLAAGKRKDAAALLKPIIEKHMDEWMTPAYIAAEADYSRVGRTPKRRKKQVSARGSAFRSTECASGRCRSPSPSASAAARSPRGAFFPSRAC